MYISILDLFAGDPINVMTFRGSINASRCTIVEHFGVLASIILQMQYKSFSGADTG
jgi:hypothetical protein